MGLCWRPGSGGSGGSHSLRSLLQEPSPPLCHIQSQEVWLRSGPPSPPLNLLLDTCCMLGEDRVVGAVLGKPKVCGSLEEAPDPACCSRERAEKGEEI